MALPKKAEKKEPGIWKTVDGRWLVDFRPGGRDSKPFRAVKDTLGEAREVKQKVSARFQSGEILMPGKDKRKLSELSQLWFDLHGHTLTSGEKRLQQLLAFSRSVGDPIGIKCKPKLFLDYRIEREADGITRNHLNHELTYIKAVFNELERAGEWKYPKPFDLIKKLKVDEEEVNYLDRREINALRASCLESRNKDLPLVVDLCLAVGARFGEANSVTAKQFRNGRVVFNKTKNGKFRSVPIDSDLVERLLEGRPRTGPLFKSCWDAFENAIENAGIQLPKGQMTHVLRHTYGAWHMMLGGDLLDLNKILGHKTIQTTMVYAHLAPDHLDRSLRFNPLAMVTKKSETENLCTPSAHPDDNSEGQAQLNKSGEAA